MERGKTAFRKGRWHRFLHPRAALPPVNYSEVTTGTPMGLGHRSVRACCGHACGSLRLHVLLLFKNAFSARGNAHYFHHSNVCLVVRLPA